MTTEDAINLLKNLGEIDDNELVDFTLSNETKYLLNKEEYNFENIDNSYDDDNKDDLEEIDYDENADIEELEGQLELDDFNDEH